MYAINSFVGLILKIYMPYIMHMHLFLFCNSQRYLFIECLYGNCCIPRRVAIKIVRFPNFSYSITLLRSLTILVIFLQLEEQISLTLKKYVGVFKGTQGILRATEGGKDTGKHIFKIFLLGLDTTNTHLWHKATSI